MAKAGFFVAGSESEVKMMLSTKLTTAIKNACSAASSGFAEQVAKVAVSTCNTGGNVEVFNVKVNQTQEIITKSITKFESVTTARNHLIQDLKGKTVSKAEGFDPTMMLIIIVAVILGVLLIGPVTIVKMVLSPWLWFLVGIGAAGFGIYLDISTLTHTWPSGNDDSPSKKKNLLIGGSAAAGAGTLVAVIMGFLIAHKKKRVVTMLQAATPSAPKS